ncbi:MAG TPA: hypothetical protein VM054_00080 [bacterium]|nr:hypothetical protein [bacterium]
MRGLLIAALLAALVLGIAGCGEEAEEEKVDLSKPEGTVEAFLKVVQDKDQESLKGLVIDPQYVDVLWPLIDEKGLTISGGYVLEEGLFGTTVTFENARYTENNMSYDLELTLSEDRGKWLISGYMTVLAGDETTDTGRIEEPEEDLGAAALEYLKANYSDEVKAISDKYAGDDFGGDVQYYIRFVDGKFDRINSVATGHGDDRAYNNEAFRAELDKLVETFEVDSPGEVDVFWVVEFPM